MKPAHRLLIPLATLALAGALAHWFFSRVEPVEYASYESIEQTYPAPRELPPVHLPGFRQGHPRLPHPSKKDLLLLRQLNPGYLERRKKRAAGGKGDLYSSILTAYVEPGSQDLARLLQRILESDFAYRGANVGDHALAYDWLYDQWSGEQRRALRQRLIEDCNGLIHLIRKQRLSPYNVFLYNRPFQNLMACTLAVYDRGEDAGLVMRFTADYWKNRILPVWRQVMGQNGGWHEGGEYVGIGIGQAIYQLPAMWRSATGENLFASEPGIRGFLDFLVYRTRPDGTHFRWGDAGFFDRHVPDRLALALEYGHQAAYSLGRKPRLEPTSWPWGPLSPPGFHDPASIEALPLARYFDGIGLLVARSGWDPDATYVTFKAGDNYWSHSHLDQGSFTLYKGGALAIDSGLYYRYGSDHHMNYTYQTIAHNTITVTDPEDQVPAPGRKDVRYIANDGGQRRIGSGWGIESAPLDLEEWQRKREIYHTATMKQVRIEKEFVAATADLTPAYTNALSGKGTFSHRTRRVERFLRTFIYDRELDAVILFDVLTSTRPGFKKRWLLHTLEEPLLESGREFLVTVQPEPRPGHRGGWLHGVVLLPDDATLTKTGGAGREFLVEGIHYDDHGKVQETARKRIQSGTASEPGAWRIELSPASFSSRDLFLVALFPSRVGSPDGEASLIEQEGEMGIEISRNGKRVRYWFDHDTLPFLHRRDPPMDRLHPPR